MRLEGRIFKNKGFFLVEIESLGLLTQGRTLAEAKRMSKAAIEDSIEDKNFKAYLTFLSDRKFIIESSNSKLLTGWMLRNLRQKKGLTVREVANRLNAKSPRAYTAYENGDRMPSSDKFSQLIEAIDPQFKPVTHLVKVS